MTGRTTFWKILGSVALGLVVAGCERTPGMGEQPRYQPYEASSFFADGLSARPLVTGTVVRGAADRDPHLYQGVVDGKPATTMPFVITMDDLKRGQEQFGIFCSPCHGLVGDGQGMIALRGFNPPPESLHQQRLREAPPGYIFHVITNGFGAMFGYEARIEPIDRWRIIAYVRALQLSQHAPVAQLPGAVRRQLEQGDASPR